MLIPCPMMMTSIQKLYSIREHLKEMGVSSDAAEMYARMYPFFAEYEHGVSIQQVARFLQRSGKEVRRQMHELTKKGFLERMHYRAWGITEQTKEKIDGAT
jgi:Mn-dependent DtxR family transcriptional regulator